jgi:hypothetical protein
MTKDRGNAKGFIGTVGEEAEDAIEYIQTRRVKLR